jgi:hypothetical protein
MPFNSATGTYQNETGDESFDPLRHGQELNEQNEAEWNGVGPPVIQVLFPDGSARWRGRQGRILGQLRQGSMYIIILNITKMAVLTQITAIYAYSSDQNIGFQEKCHFS